MRARTTIHLTWSRAMIRRAGAVVLLALVSGASAVDADNLYREDGYKLVNGVDHFFRMVGEGEPFVVLHGGPGMYHDELYPFFQEFARNHRVIFYDQRGNGRSRLETIDTSTFSVELLVADLEGLRQAFGIEQLNLIGHSWGGLLAMYYAVEHPEHVKRLILVDAAPVNSNLVIASYENQISRYTPEEWEQLQALWESERYRVGDPEIHNQAMRLSEGVVFHDKSVIDAYMQAAAFNAEKALAAVALGDLATRIKLSITVQSGLAKIACPTLILQGEHDFIVPEAPRLAHELIAGSELVVIPDSGHYPHIENPVALFGAIDAFLEKTR